MMEIKGQQINYDDTDDSTNSIWNKLTTLCRENNNRYRFRTTDGDYIIRYNEISDTYNLIKSKITKMTDEEIKEKRRQHAREKYHENLEFNRAEKRRRAREFAERNKEKDKELRTAYYTQNKESIRAKQKERYEKNKRILDAVKNGEIQIITQKD